MRAETTPKCATAIVALALSLVAAGTAAAGLDSATAASGLKEALETGADRAVGLLGQEDGYLGNPDVKIDVPDQIESVSKALRKLGMDDMVEEFVTSMNRAAEAAAPLAKEVFVKSIRDMTIEDALTIVRGKDHEATDYLRLHAGAELATRFRPIVVDRLEAVGATQSFSAMMERTSAIPFFKKPAFELDAYVTDRALDGLFLMIAREEERIRKDPVARTTDLLKKVFGGGGDDGKKSWWKKLTGGD